VTEKKVLFCSECGTIISEVDKEYTEAHYGKALCWNCFRRHIISDSLTDMLKKHKEFSKMLDKLKEENEKVEWIDKMFGGSE